MKRFLAFLFSSFGFISFAQLATVDSLTITHPYSNFAFNGFLITDSTNWLGFSYVDYSSGSPSYINKVSNYFFKINLDPFKIADTIKVDTNFLGITPLTGTDTSLVFLGSSRLDSSIWTFNWSKKNGLYAQPLLGGGYKGTMSLGPSGHLKDDIYFALESKDSIHLFSLINGGFSYEDSFLNLPYSYWGSSCSPYLSVSQNKVLISCHKFNETYIWDRNTKTYSLRNMGNLSPGYWGLNFTIADSIYHVYNSGDIYSDNVSIFSSVSDSNYRLIHDYDNNGWNEMDAISTRFSKNSKGQFFMIHSEEPFTSGTIAKPVLGCFSPENDSISGVWKGHKHSRYFSALHSLTSNSDFHFVTTLTFNAQNGNEELKLYLLGPEDLNAMDNPAIDFKWRVFNRSLSFDGSFESGPFEVKILNLSGQVMFSSVVERLSNVNFSFKDKGVYVLEISSNRNISVTKVFVE